MIRTSCLAGLLAVVLLLGGGTLSADEAGDSLIRLETHLEKIRKEYEFSRLLGGIGLVTAGTFVAGAGTALSFYFLSDTSSPGIVQSRNLGIALSVGYGALFVVPGSLVLALKPDYETMPEQFSKMPASNADEMQRKIARGEVTLQSLADKARFERLLTAGLLGLGGGVMLYTTVMMRPSYPGEYSTYASPSFASDPGFATGVMYLGAALLRFVLQSTPENENEAYLRWKETL